MGASDGPVDPAMLRKVRKNAFAGAIGNVMEWYDFAAYAYMAPIMSSVFFPSSDPFASLLATYGAFAAGYMARPLGALAFGHIGDKFGRKRLLVLSVWLMGAATVSIGLLPTHDQVGPLAAVLLVLLRILQGCSVGGEFTGSSTFVVEHAPSSRRGFFASWIVVGCTAGFLAGSGVATLLSNVLGQEVLEDWAWRLPFLSGGLIAVGALLLRRHIEEPPAPTYDEEWERSPVVTAFVDHWRGMLRVVGLALAVNVGFYMMFVYAVSYLTERMHVSTAKAMDINTLCMVVLTFLPLVFSRVSDRLGRKPLLLAGNLGIMLLAWPLFWFMHHQDGFLILIGQLGFAVLFACVFSINPATQAEILPRRVRVSALSVSYSLCLSVFGGTTPLVAAYLVQRTGDDFAPVYYLIALAAVSFVTVLTIPETSGKALRE